MSRPDYVKKKSVIKKLKIKQMSKKKKKMTIFYMTYFKVKMISVNKFN